MTDLTKTAVPEDLSGNLDTWYKAVAGVFARAQKKDVGDIPTDIWKKLIVTTPDGVDINPLYTRVDETNRQLVEVPGEFPFTRGASADQERTGWGVTETFGTDETSVKEINEAVLHALNSGTTTLAFEFSEDFTAADLPDALEGVHLNMVPLLVHAGANTTEVARELYALAEEAGTPFAALTLGSRPLTAQVDGTISDSVDEAIELAKNAAKRAQVRAIVVDGSSFANQGASDAQEIGLSLAVGVDYVRRLVAAGLDAKTALSQLSFRFAITDEQFAQISKLRVARRLWARVCEVLEHPEEGSAPQHAVTARAMFSQRDPWVNMLRSTVAAFAAGVGGATDVEVRNFDDAIAGGVPGVSRNFAHRIARNTNLLLLEESHLGHVIDPAGGSYFVESFTNDLAQKAWEVFSGIEAQGGFSEAFAAGQISDMLDQTWEKTRKDIASRKKKLTGINEFPNLAETPLPAERRVEPFGVRRWAAEFEELRNRSDAFLGKTGARPSITLIPLGPLSKHNIRTGFTTNLLASGGIVSINPGQLVPGTAEFADTAKAAEIVVVCGTDQEYAETGEGAVEKLREAGLNRILLAGAPASFEGSSQAPDGYLNMTIDAAATLADLLKALGA